MYTRYAHDFVSAVHGLASDTVHDDEEAVSSAHIEHCPIVIVCIRMGEICIR